MRGPELVVAMCLLFVTSAAAQRPAAREYGRLPLMFEPNQGQADPAVKFLARTGGGTLFLTEREAVLVSGGTAPVRMRLTHAVKPEAIQGLEPTGGISNYFIGNDPAKWRTSIPNYKRVEYKSVYAGVDLVYYGNPQKLEYDLVVAPGADVAAIQMEYEGVESLRVDRDGDLVLKTATGELRQKRPVAYQETASGRVEVQVGYRLKKGRRVAFELAQYDAKRRLVIDPVLLYQIDLGGSLFAGGAGIAVDGAGNAYVTGDTNSFDFPTMNALQWIKGGGCRDAFVTKVNAAGTALVYSTYLGGSGDDYGTGIAVDGSGNAYVTGSTISTDFPTANALQPIYGGGIGGGGDAFVTKISSAGSALVYSTYLGGAEFDQGLGIAVDGSGSAYVTGQTSSSNFPTMNAVQPNIGGPPDAFVTKINPAGSALVYSTFLGGSGWDGGFGIGVDVSGDAYVTGSTTSSNFPIINPVQGSTVGSGAFVTKVNAAGSAFVYSTYLGPVGSAYGIAVDGAGNCYVTGGYGGTTGAFAIKINAAGSAFVYSTSLGGFIPSVGNGIAVDGSGNAYVAGTAGSAFVTEVSATGSILYSLALGGTPTDGWGQAIAVGGPGNAYITGATRDTSTPGNYEAFVAMIASNAAEPILVTPNFGSGGTQVFSFVAQDTLGANSIQYVQFLYSKAGINGSNACYISYDPFANVFYLLSDDTTEWYGLQGGSANNIGNAQCTVYGTGSGSTKSGYNLITSINVSFRTGFAGAKNIYQFSEDTVGHGSQWQFMGTWSDSGDPSLAEIVSLTPRAGSGLSQTFTAVVKDGNGGNAIAFTQLVMNTGLNGYNGCFIHYDRASSVFFLLSDAGTAWSGLLSGSATQVQNSQCILQGAGSGGTVSGTNLTITYNLSFKAGFTGSKQIYMQTADQAGINEVWHQTATWTP